jgi:hypothetical protein
MLLVLGFALHQRMVSVPSPSPKAAATAALPHAVATDSSASQSPQQI